MNFGLFLAALRRRAPLVHCITNPVSINDCANLLLACGASPIMADAPEEAAEITALSQGLVLNLGMLHRERLTAMLAAGQQANALGIPVVLDPVGAGASAFRTSSAQTLMAKVRLAVIRCNLSELEALGGVSAASRGVDTADTLNAAALERAGTLARSLARQTGAVVAVTGPTDLVTDGTATCAIHNGHPRMSRVTGTGCQLSCLVAAFAAANPGHGLPAAAAAVCMMGLCGELAFARLTACDGNATYRDKIIDAVDHMTPAQLEEGARYDFT